MINPTMREFAERYFLPSIPASFEVMPHESDIETSGNFNQDNYTAVVTERTDAIQKVERKALTAFALRLSIYCKIVSQDRLLHHRRPWKAIVHLHDSMFTINSQPICVTVNRLTERSGWLN